MIPLAVRRQKRELKALLAALQQERRALERELARLERAWPSRRATKAA